MKKLTVKEVERRLSDRQIRLVSEYINTQTQTTWQCQICNHKWETTASSVISQKTGCPKCAGYCQSVKTMIELASTRNFEFLSATYKGMNNKYEWKCPDGHTWMATAHHIKSGTGCPYCKSYITEEACRFIFQELTGCDFKKNRSILGTRLELDGYCNKLKIAFEYQGKQHYAFIKHLHRRLENHEAQKRRDELKKCLCKEKRIDLLEIPYHVNDLEPFIRSKLELRGINCSETIDWSKFKN